jgi:hypothetical protein
MQDVKFRPVQSALREMQAIFTSPVRLLAMGVAIALLALSGPFGTLDYDAPTRLIYWAVVVVASYSSGHVGGVIAAEWLGEWLPALPLRVPAIALAASLPAALVVILVTFIVEPDSAPNPLLLWFYVFAVCLALITLLSASGRYGTPALAEVVSELNKAPPLLDRLPLPQRGRLLHIAVSDHYVDVTTEKGTALVLMRLSDAIRETEPEPGIQVHRSHWVALAAVRRGLRQDGKPMLELENGALVPVSRSFIKDVRSAGLLV